MQRHAPELSVTQPNFVCRSAGPALPRCISYRLTAIWQEYNHIRNTGFHLKTPARRHTAMALHFKFGCRQPHGPDVVERARVLVEDSVLSQVAIAAEVGVSRNTIVNWQRREGWVRPPGKRRGRGVVAAGEVRPRPRRMASGGKARFYGPEIVEAVRRLVEDSVLTQGAIAARTGVSHETIRIWTAREGWSRPAGTTVRPSSVAVGDAAASSRTAPLGGANARFRRVRGRPYVPDVAERVRVLVEGTGLSQAAIAARTGVGAATVATWMRRRNWTRPLDAYRCTRLVAADRAGLGRSGRVRGRAGPGRSGRADGAPPRPGLPPPRRGPEPR